MSSKAITINIAKEFSSTPGARSKTDGPYSGEEFRENFLEGPISDEEVERIIVLLDGTEGYATSFLEEAFGGLARKYGVDKCIKKIDFISTEDPLLIDEIKKYIEGKK